MIRLKKSIPVANGLGECILWDTEKQLVRWTDMPGRKLYTHDPSKDRTWSLELDEDLCSFALVKNSDELLCAFQSGLALMHPESGQRQWLHRIDNPELIRLNDGRVDRQGRFWVGSLIDNEGNVPDNGIAGELLRIDADGTISKHLGGIGISNSICWSPDGRILYFADTPRKEIWRFDFDPDAGTISNQRVFAKTPQEAGPDGSVVDADGGLWNAEWGLGRVVRYAPDGRINCTIQLPVSHITCLAFAGPALSDLYVTTATYGLEEYEDGAGDVFVFETSFRGLKEHRFVSRLGTSPAG